MQLAGPALQKSRVALMQNGTNYKPVALLVIAVACAAVAWGYFSHGDSFNGKQLKPIEALQRPSVGEYPPLDSASTPSPAASGKAIVRTPLSAPARTYRIGKVDASRLTGGLAAFIDNAIALNKGADAYLAVQALEGCDDTQESLMRWHARASQKRNDAARVAMLEEYERRSYAIQQCSAVQGDLHEVRTKLLTIASSQNVFGSHGQLLWYAGSDASAVGTDGRLAGRSIGELQSLALADAKSGDLMSITYLSSVSPPQMRGISKIEVQAAKLALQTLEATLNGSPSKPDASTGPDRVSIENLAATMVNAYLKRTGRSK